MHKKPYFRVQKQRHCRTQYATFREKFVIEPYQDGICSLITYHFHHHHHSL